MALAMHCRRTQKFPLDQEEYYCHCCFVVIAMDVIVVIVIIVGVMFDGRQIHF